MLIFTESTTESKHRETQTAAMLSGSPSEDLQVSLASTGV